MNKVYILRKKSFRKTMSAFFQMIINIYKADKTALSILQTCSGHNPQYYIILHFFKVFVKKNYADKRKIIKIYLI